MAVALFELAKDFISMFSRNQNVDIYLLFKAINQNYYINSVRISHWQVICHFKDTNRYKCYELQTDNGDEGGNIVYQISDFEFNSTIYYYYVGQCSMSEEELKQKCDSISINNRKYILGLRDCQSWARLFIESLGLSVNGIGPALARYVPIAPFGIVQTIQGRIVDLLVEQDPILNFLLSRVKTCNGYESLDPTHKIPLSSIVQ